MAFISSGGSVSAPAFAFTGTSSNTGIYLPGQDSIGFAIDGVIRGRIAAEGTFNVNTAGITSTLGSANVAIRAFNTVYVAGDTIESSFNSHLLIGDGSMTKDPTATFSITGGYRWSISGDTTANSGLSFKYVESANTEKRPLTLSRSQTVGINTTAPAAYSTSNTNVTNAFEVVTGAQNSIASMCAISNSDTSSHSSQLILTATGGTYASKTAVANGRRVALISGNAYNGSTYTGVANQSVHVDGTVTSGANIPGYWQLTTNSGSGLAEALTLSKEQRMLHAGKVQYQYENFSMLGAATRTITLTGLNYGWFKLIIGGSDGNAQRVGLEVTGAGQMWSGGTGYGVIELFYNNSTASATRTQNNTSYVVVVTAGTNPFYGNAYLISGVSSSGSGNTVMAIT